MCGDLPVPELMDGAFRFGGFLSFLGRIVSLLGFSRRLPSPRPEAERSWLAMVDCATDWTVSVSTVMLRKGGSARDRLDKEESDGLEETEFCRWVEEARWSCILPFLSALVAPSLPLSEFLVLLRAVLRSSVTLDELTSFRSSSEPLCEMAGGTKLDCRLAKGCDRGTEFNCMWRVQRASR